MPPVDWAKAFEHLPEKDIISNIDDPGHLLEMPNTTGGGMINALERLRVAQQAPAFEPCRSTFPASGS
jgi:hypothetical protein